MNFNLIELSIIYFGLAMCSASLISILQIMFKKGELLSFYLPFLSRSLIKLTNVKSEDMDAICKQETDYTECKQNLIYGLILSNPILTMLFKPLGGCGVCMNMWFSFFIFLIMSIFIIPVNILYFFAYSLISHYLYILIAQR
jgi:hypothetical protein